MSPVLDQGLRAAAAALFLALGVLAAFRGGRSPLAPPASFLGFAVFAYETLKIVRGLSSDPIWGPLDRAAASLVGPPTLWLVAAFVGRARALRGPLFVASAYFAVLAIACVAAAISPSIALRTEHWALAMLLGMVPTFGAIPVVLAVHAYRATTEERARTQIFGLAMLLGVAGVTSELLALAGARAPHVGALGLASSALLLGALLPRVRVFERVTLFTIVSALALGSVAVLGHAMIVAWFGDRTLLVVFGTVTLTLALLAALRPLQVHLSEGRARARHLATLGRFSAQMAQDLRSPLAAIEDAARFLSDETANGRTIDAHDRLLETILAESDRLARVVDTYQRLGRVEAVRAPVDLAKLLADILAVERKSAYAEGVELRSELRLSGPEVLIDRDLVEGALENLLRNAREALAGRSGHVTLVAEQRGHQVVLRVRDDGPGMNARTRERAFDEFFTTKESGSGVGLSLVARVAQAHGGRVAIESEEGRGTIVEMTLARVAPTPDA